MLPPSFTLQVSAKRLVPKELYIYPTKYEAPAYITFKKKDGKFRGESTIKKFGGIEKADMHGNVPVTGIKLIRAEGGTSTMQPYVRMSDPRGWIIDIPDSDAVVLIREIGYDPEKGFTSGLVYTWHEDKLILVPCTDKELDDYHKADSGRDSLKLANLVPGVYYDNKKYPGYFLGYQWRLNFEAPEYPYYNDYVNEGVCKCKLEKTYLFQGNYFFTLTSTSLPFTEGSKAKLLPEQIQKKYNGYTKIKNFKHCDTKPAGLVAFTGNPSNIVSTDKVLKHKNSDWIVISPDGKYMLNIRCNEKQCYVLDSYEIISGLTVHHTRITNEYSGGYRRRDIKTHSLETMVKEYENFTWVRNEHSYSSTTLYIKDSEGQEHPIR